MASETKPPIKGILKKPKTSPGPAQPSNTAAGTASRARQPPTKDPRQIAIQHARILQDRKDTEAQILDNVIALLDFPRDPAAPASAPDPSDARDFAALVRIFQPSDYDDLVVERNIDGDKCGYALCGQKRRRYPGAGAYKMVNKGRRDFDIVETRELEKWCGTECARRALWVKVQLNETAAWERVGMPEIEIELYPEKKDGEEEGKAPAAEGRSEPERLAAEMSRLQLQEDRKATRDAKDLALERGDDAKAAPRSKVDIVVREKTVTTQAEAPALGDGAEGDSVEGYKIKFGTESEKAS